MVDGQVVVGSVQTMLLQALRSTGSIAAAQWLLRWLVDLSKTEGHAELRAITRAGTNTLADRE